MKSIIFILTVCLSVLSGCALQQDMVALNERIMDLEARNRQLEQRYSATVKQSDRIKSQIESQIKDYSKINEEKAQNLRSQSAELQALFEGFREEIQEIRGRLEETDYLLKERLKSVEESDKNADVKIDRLEEQLDRLDEEIKTAIASAQKQASQRSEPAYTETRSEYRPSGSADKFQEPATSSSIAEGLSDNELYALAKQAFDRNDFETSRQGFKKLITAYPKSRRADNAQFWLGEIYYRQKRYEEAILEYQEVIEKYPDGNKIKAALLKQGFAFFNLGDKDNARLILQELVDRYPDSSEAKLAKDKLDWF